MNRTLEGKDGAPASATVADVLELHPATQGVASVVGLLSLAAQHGQVDPDAVDLLRWPAAAGMHSAHVIRHRFTERLP